MTEEQNEAVNEETQTPVGEEQHEEGVDTQVASEQEAKPSDQEINWSRANETMKQQSDEIRILRSELSQFREKNAPKEEEGVFGDNDPDDILTFRDFNKVLSKQKAEYDQKLAEYEVKTRYPDFNETIEKYGKLLPESVKMSLLNGPNPHMAAYEACKILSDKDALSKTVHPNAKRIKDNLSKTGSASAVGNSGTLSEAKKFENMSEEEVLQQSARILNGI